MTYYKFLINEMIIWALYLKNIKLHIPYITHSFNLI